AVKYGDGTSPITLTLNQSATSATLSIQNFGEPISPSELHMLFEPFRRAKTVKGKVGWGLGLTLVKGMVEGHKGTIKVESDKAKGTTFIINVLKDSREAEVEEVTSSSAEVATQIPKA
ncbi:MAG: sensor histidine kinase, partial [Bdellovibrionales bacterium]|nr:sensor histidine kinase [Bdellovibrionales bacterium]